MITDERLAELQQLCDETEIERQSSFDQWPVPRLARAVPELLREIAQARADEKIFTDALAAHRQALEEALREWRARVTPSAVCMDSNFSRERIAELCARFHLDPV